MSTSGAYYNDTDKYCADWLRGLIRAGLIPDGDIDTRSIRDVVPGDVRGYRQCHFFAGLGGWAYALRCAGWPDERPIWTGSAPCQPFSVAGKGLGEADSRHLWPDFFRLIQSARPTVLMGEQVAGAAGYAWFDGVAASLESEDYACRAVDIPAAAVNAPHIRQRLYWVADTDRGRLEQHEPRQRSVPEFGADGERDGCASRLANAYRPRLSEHGRAGADAPEHSAVECASPSGWLGDAEHAERRKDAEGRIYVDHGPDAGRQEAASRSELASADASASGVGPWDDWEIVGPDEKGKWRRVKPGLPLLAARLPGDVPKLRAIGNALVAPLAVEVIRAYMEAYA